MFPELTLDATPRISLGVMQIRRRQNGHKCQADVGTRKRRGAADYGRRKRWRAKDKIVILYCASGGRAALGGKVLKDLGYDRVYNLGAFKDWAESGGSVEKPIAPRA